MVTLDVIPPAHPGDPHTIHHAPATTDQIALTIDDGYCADCVASYVEFARSSGIHITFSPNGAYQAAWNPHGSVLRPLIEAGQVQIGNHTYSHHDLRPMSASRIEAELERNEAWIERTFGVTSRPWYRPPYGFHTDRVDDIAGQLGYTNVLMWNGTYGDSGEITPEVLMAPGQEVPDRRHDHAGPRQPSDGHPPVRSDPGADPRAPPHPRHPRRDVRDLSPTRLSPATA